MLSYSMIMNRILMTDFLCLGQNMLFKTYKKIVIRFSMALLNSKLEFKALFIIQIYTRDTFILCVYVILECVDFNSYEFLFSFFKFLFDIKHPTDIKLNFEAALSKSLKKVFQTGRFLRFVLHFTKIYYKLQVWGFSCMRRNILKTHVLYGLYYHCIMSRLNE